MAKSYVLVAVCPGHPLKPAGGNVGRHRLVLWEAIGSGPHKCGHCGAVVRWEDGSLHVDHKDHRPGNDVLSNLEPSCRRCNTKRGRKSARVWETYDRAAYERDGTVRPRVAKSS